MTGTLDRWNMRELRDLYSHKEKAPANKDQGEGETNCGDEDSAELTPKQQAHDRYARLAAESVLRQWDKGNREVARGSFCLLAGIVAARSPDHIARLERLKGLAR